MPPSLAPIRNWIFDLDNTLYPASADLFAQIDVKMTAYVADLLGTDLVEARRIQKAYFLGHGTTLAGLMKEHKVDPLHYLDFVHDIEMEVLEENLPLAAAIARLPGRKIVFTNGDGPYARRVLDRLGLGASFEAIHDIHAMDLAPAKAIGMTTVWVDNGSEQAEGTDRSFVDYTTHDLTHWLQGIL